MPQILSYLHFSYHVLYLPLSHRSPLTYSANTFAMAPPTCLRRYETPACLPPASETPGYIFPAPVPETTACFSPATTTESSASPAFLSRHRRRVTSVSLPAPETPEPHSPTYDMRDSLSPRRRDVRVSLSRHRDAYVSLHHRRDAMHRLSPPSPRAASFLSHTSKSRNVSHPTSESGIISLPHLRKPHCLSLPPPRAALSRIPNSESRIVPPQSESRIATCGSSISCSNELRPHWCQALSAFAVSLGNIGGVQREGGYTWGMLAFYKKTIIPDIYLGSNHGHL